MAAYRNAFSVCFLGAFLASASLAQPTISWVANYYSYVPPGLPNYGIAQGSIFVIFGAGLAGSSIPLQRIPLSNTLAGVIVNVSVCEVTTRPILYYVSPTQIAAILPSATPVGAGQITVINNGQSS